MSSITKKATKRKASKKGDEEEAKKKREKKSPAKPARTTFGAGYIKSIMYQDEEVGRMAASVPVLLGSMTGNFLKALVKSAAEKSSTASSVSSSSITPDHIRAAISADARFDFLANVATEMEAAVTSLPAEEEEETHAAIEATAAEAAAGNEEEEEDGGSTASS